MKAIKNIGAVAAIIILSVLIGLSAQFLKSYTEHANHPKRFSEYVEKYSEEFRVPESLIYSVIKCESSFDSAAVSRAGAIGLMQIKPATFEWLCQKRGDNYETGMLYDPDTNIRYGTYYLSMLYERFGVWETACAAYNCGPSRVASWIEEGKVTESGRLTEIPISETAAYVERVFAAKEKYDSLYYSEK